MPSDINPLSGTSLESILTGRVEDLKRPHVADRAIQKLDPSDNRSDPESEVRDKFSATMQFNLAEGPEGPGRNQSLEDEAGQVRRKGDLLNVFF